MISEKELNSYRLTSMEEPTDEMLAQIMHEAAEIYNRENEEAYRSYFANMQKQAKEQRQKFNLNNGGKNTQTRFNCHSRT